MRKVNTCHYVVVLSHPFVWWLHWLNSLVDSMCLMLVLMWMGLGLGRRINSGSEMKDVAASLNGEVDDPMPWWAISTLPLSPQSPLSLSHLNYNVIRLLLADSSLSVVSLSLTVRDSTNRYSRIPLTPTSHRIKQTDTKLRIRASICDFRAWIARYDVVCVFSLKPFPAQKQPTQTTLFRSPFDSTGFNSNSRRDWDSLRQQSLLQPTCWE